MISVNQYRDNNCAGAYNVGPDDQDCMQTGELVDRFVKYWGGNLRWIDQYDGGPHEANFLKLDCSKLKSAFDWKPRWNLDKAVEKTVEWTKCWNSGGNVSECMERQIQEFLES